MSRTTYILNYSDLMAADRTIEKILREENYDLISENGEKVWKCGHGTWAAIKYIKVEFMEDNMLHLSGWVRSSTVGEMNLDGVIGGLPKKQVLAVIKRIKTSVQ